MFELKLARTATQRGPVVHWQNAVGPALGQSGVWTFDTEDDARAFADYAIQDPAPSLAFKDLEAADIPRPVYGTRKSRPGDPEVAFP